jgi:hypothetical protein
VTTSHAEYARACLDRDDAGPSPGLRILSERRLVARVTHDCDGCDEAGGIQPDVPYAQVVELDWGRLAIRRYCLDGRCRPDQALPPLRGYPGRDCSGGVASRFEVAMFVGC